MKPLVNLLVIGSLVVAVLGAVTAYMPRLSLPDDQLVGLTLGSDAGKDQAGKPLVPAKSKLTAEHLAQLRDSGAKRIHVREFSLARWSGLWLFLAGTAGLIAGSVAARRSRAPQAAASQGRTASVDDARRSLSEIRAVIADIRATLQTMDAAGASAIVLERIGAAQRDLVPAFLNQRPAIAAALGQARTAQVMERFAMGERSMNRAWSAAADGFTDELDETLSTADEQLAQSAEHQARG